jgi:hypothetical protein
LSRRHGYAVHIDVHAARSPTARPKARFFGPAQIRHGPVASVPVLARSGGACRAWAATPARWAARHDPVKKYRPVKGPINPPLPASYLSLEYKTRNPSLSLQAPAHPTSIKCCRHPLLPADPAPLSRGDRISRSRAPALLHRPTLAPPLPSVPARLAGSPVASSSTLSLTSSPAAALWPAPPHRPQYARPLPPAPARPDGRSWREARRTAGGARDGHRLAA